MKTNEAGKAIIKFYEGLRLRAYLDVAGILTIGYGHTGKDVFYGRMVTKAEAEALFERDLEKFEVAVAKIVTEPVNENQFSAMVSLCYNIGPGRFAGSTVVNRTNRGDFIRAADAFDMWNKARVKGELVVLPGLVTRRTAEKELFLKPVETETCLQS